MTVLLPLPIGGDPTGSIAYWVFFGRMLTFSPSDGVLPKRCRNFAFFMVCAHFRLVLNEDTGGEAIGVGSPLAPYSPRLQPLSCSAGASYRSVLNEVPGGDVCVIGLTLSTFYPHRSSLPRDANPYWSWVGRHPMAILIFTGCGAFLFPRSASPSRSVVSPCVRPTTYCVIDLLWWVGQSSSLRLYATAILTRQFLCYGLSGFT